MTQKKNFVAVLPDNSEYFEEVAFGTRHDRSSVRQVAENAVRKAKLTTPRANPQTVRVHVYTLAITQGKLERTGATTFDIMPRLERLTEDEYNAQMEVAVAELPKEFQAYVRHQAWDQGHSAGYEEVVNIACAMAYDLQPIINAYTENLPRT